MSIPNCFKGYTPDHLRQIADAIEEEKARKDKKQFTVFRGVLREDIIDYGFDCISFDDLECKTDAEAKIRECQDRMKEAIVFTAGDVMYRIEESRAWCHSNLKSWWPYDDEKYYKDIEEVDPESVPEDIMAVLVKFID